MEGPNRAINPGQITFFQLLASKREGLGKGQAGHKAGDPVLALLVQTDPSKGTISQPTCVSLSPVVCHHHLKNVVVVVLVVVVVVVVIVVVVVVVGVGVYSIESIDR